MEAMNGLTLVAKMFHKLAVFLEKLSFSKQQLPTGVEIHPSSEVNLERLRLKSGCSLMVGKESQIDGSIAFEREDVSISIGDRVFISGSLIAAHHIKIGDDVLIAWGVTLMDQDAHSISFSKRAKDAVDWRAGKKDWSHVKTAPIVISDKAWIGFNSIILKGVTIGEGAVVGAGSVVTKNVPAWTIAAGNPACIIREIPENER
jgi:acetyltransferase-like isoleucine patch superfamily enzyme